MKSGLTYIIFVIDRSGSMASIRDDMIGGFNSFIKTQKDAKLGQCKVFAYKFDTKFDTMFEDFDIEQVPALDRGSYEPRGGTALYDSLGKVIKFMGDKLSALPEDQRPEKVLVVTITDGEDNSYLENDSIRFSSTDVKNMVGHQTKNYKWDFAYIGANQDAWAVGGKMGVANNINYTATAAGTAYLFDNLSRSATNYRGTKGVKFAFCPDTEDDAKVKVQVNVNPVSTPTRKA